MLGVGRWTALICVKFIFSGHIVEVILLWHLVSIHEQELMAVSELLVTVISVTG